MIVAMQIENHIMPVPENSGKRLFLAIWISNGSFQNMDNYEIPLWEMTIDIASKSLEETRQELSEVVDRFTWETGSDEDREEIRRLEFAVHIRKCIANHCNCNK